MAKRKVDARPADSVAAAAKSAGSGAEVVVAEVDSRARPFRKHGNSIPEALPWILERVKSGIPINHACESAGFSKQALYQHCQRNPDDRLALDQAKAEGEEWLIQGLYDAAREDPKFGLLLVERRRPEEWGKVEKLEHTGKDGAPIAVTAARPTRAQAAEAMAAMLGMPVEELLRRLGEAEGAAGLLTSGDDGEPEE